MPAQIARTHSSLRSWAERLIKDGFNLITPAVCAGCGRRAGLLCGDCRAALPWVTPPVCARCCRPLAQPAATCADCDQLAPALQVVAAACWFEGPLRELIHAYKYGRQFALADVLAEIMQQAYPTDWPAADLLLPVPLHAAREQERGFNQARLLAERLGAQHNSVVDVNALYRQRATRQQVGLSAGQRRQNVHAAFVADPLRVAGRQIVLIDDVCTTGATLSAAAETLRRAGAAGVRAYCAARARVPRADQLSLLSE